MSPVRNKPRHREIKVTDVRVAVLFVYKFHYQMVHCREAPVVLPVKPFAADKRFRLFVTLPEAAFVHLYEKVRIYLCHFHAEEILNKVNSHLSAGISSSRRSVGSSIGALICLVKEGYAGHRLALKSAEGIVPVRDRISDGIRPDIHPEIVTVF